MKAREKIPVVSPNVYVAPGAVIVGDVVLDEGVNVWFHSTIRGDACPIAIGSNSNVQDNVVIHGDSGGHVTIGKGVSIGHSAIIHGCEIGDNTIIGMGAIIMDGAEIGKNCLIGAGALVTHHKIIPEGSLVVGAPGKVVKKLSEDEIAHLKENAEEYLQKSCAHRNGLYKHSY